MAARLRKKHQDDVREKIKVSQLVNLLTEHALNPNKEIAQSRIKAAEVLLKKAMPDLSAVEMTQHEELPAEDVLVDRILSLIGNNPELKKQIARKLNQELAGTSKPVSVDSIVDSREDQK